MNLLIDEVELKVEWNTMIMAKKCKAFFRKVWFKSKLRLKFTLL